MPALFLICHCREAAGCEQQATDWRSTGKATPSRQEATPRILFFQVNMKVRESQKLNGTSEGRARMPCLIADYYRLQLQTGTGTVMHASSTPLQEFSTERHQLEGLTKQWP